MPKRFTDTDKYRKPFFRGLRGAYKLLWDYLYHNCDNAGIWIKDFEIAQTYIGSDMVISEEEALKFFGDRVTVFDDGAKWFLPSFIEFQYDCTVEQLNPKNNAHLSVIKKLKKEGLISPSPGAQDKDKDKDKDPVLNNKKECVSKLEVFEGIFSDEIFLTELQRTHKGKNLEQAFEECWLYHAQKPSPPEELWEWKQKLTTWLTIKKSDNGPPKNKSTDHVTGLMEGFQRRHGAKTRGG